MFHPSRIYAHVGHKKKKKREEEEERYQWRLDVVIIRHGARQEGGVSLFSVRCQ